MWVELNLEKLIQIQSKTTSQTKSEMVGRIKS